jgi:DNA-binding transcriptional LysR family regulator
MMDTSWLQDFLTLADCGNFSRAAELRNVTQPAFSRRIRMLEEWAGAELIDRRTHNTALTPAGELFRPAASEILRRLNLAQQECREAGQANSRTLRFASTHALSQTFFPSWLRSMEQRFALGTFSLLADHMQACEQLMLQGHANFLLCHHHPAQAVVLEGQSFRSVLLGKDVLLPVSAPGSGGTALHSLPGTPDQPASFLAYTEASGMGRILAACRAQFGQPLWLEAAFTSHVATVIQTMAREGRGLAWSPLSLVKDDMEAGKLVRAGDETLDIPIEIRLFRPRARQSQAAETFWSQVTATSASST